MLSPITPDQAYTYHAALIQAKAWFDHFKADVDAGQMPYPTSLATASEQIAEVLSSRSALSNSGEQP